MTYRNFDLTVDADGIAVLTWDMPGRSMNVIDETTMADLSAFIDRLAGDAAIKGAVITSGKATFSGGADLTLLSKLMSGYADQAARDGKAAVAWLFDEAGRLGRLYRRLETLGKPVVAAINGTCLGGAFELALACTGRIAVDDDGARLGLPEVRVGLIPGAGGSQRVPRLINTQEALQMILQGQRLAPRKAKALGLLDAVVPKGELIAAAKAWLKESPRLRQPWDEDGFRLPGGPVYSARGAQLWPAAAGIYRRETHDNYPAGRAILSAVYEGLMVPFDLGLRIEQRYFTKVLRSSAAGAMVRSLFVSMQELNKLIRRPAEVPPSKVKKLGILGAGFMGSGIAEVSAAVGIEVVLIDRDAAAAEAGKARVAKAFAAEVAKGRLTTAEKDARLARIAATPDFAALAGADLVIEAVFEDRAVKAEATARAQAALGDGAVFASNTSTLPITSLAETYKQADRFIGIHFFSPVDKMMLVEVILGRKTGAEALARALDFVRQIGKTPIVVNDARGFYTSRVVTTYIAEGHLMLAEGVPPAMIENVARMAGMPVGPLSLSDEVAVDLIHKIMAAARKDLGEAAVAEAQWQLIDTMVARHGRLGRKNGKGFYDYPERPGKKRLWPGLAELGLPRLDPDAIDVEELKQRFLAIQSLETAKCFAEGVLTDVREADVGSILGFGFAPFTGGTLSMIDFMGSRTFVALCDRLAARHGKRFEPPPLLREMAAKDETFYGRFPPAERPPKAA